MAAYPPRCSRVDILHFVTYETFRTHYHPTAATSAETVAIIVDGDGVEVGELTISYHAKKEERDRRHRFWGQMFRRVIKKSE
jgi:hypothetical protein